MSFNLQQLLCLMLVNLQFDMSGVNRTGAVSATLTLQIPAPALSLKYNLYKSGFCGYG